MKFTTREFITEGALIVGVIIKLSVVDHQSMGRSVMNHLVLLPVRFDLLTVLLPRQLDVVLGHDARQGDVLSSQRLRVLQTFDELERQRWMTAADRSLRLELAE